MDMLLSAVKFVSELGGDKDDRRQEHIHKYIIFNQVRLDSRFSPKKAGSAH